MDLSNLSTNLPPSIPVTQAELNELDTKLANEFKNAANSVAALYRLSNSKNSLIRYKGYLDCLDDLLNLIKLHKLKGSNHSDSSISTNNNDPASANDQNTSSSGNDHHYISNASRDGHRSNNHQQTNDGININGFDIENWCLTKKAELMGGENINNGIIFDDNELENSENILEKYANNNASDSQNSHSNEFEDTNAVDTEHVNGEEDDNKSEYTNSVNELPKKYDFKMNYATNQRFRPSMPLLSVDRKPKTRNVNGKYGRNNQALPLQYQHQHHQQSLKNGIRQQQDTLAQDSKALCSTDNELDEEITYEVGEGERKRVLSSSKGEFKKPKFENI